MAVKIRTKKATPSQAHLKICAYGPTGGGKTILMLGFLEWACSLQKDKRAFVFDTERSTDFYTVKVPDRRFHPDAFDFDTTEVPTRQVVELRDFLRDLEASDVYCAVGVDSMSHFWDSAFDLYTGKRTSQGGIPVPGWQKIKKPWRQMMEFGIFGPFHFFFTAREGTAFEKTEESDFEARGTKPRAEKETGYEPSMTLRCFQERAEKNTPFAIKVYVEKDRTGIWTGKEIDFTSANVTEFRKKIDAFFRPVLDVLANPDGWVPVPTTDAQAEKAVDVLEAERVQKETEADALAVTISESIGKSRTIDELRAAWKLTDGNKIKLGERYEDLMEAKNARKAAILTAAASVSL